MPNVKVQGPAWVERTGKTLAMRLRERIRGRARISEQDVN